MWAECGEDPGALGVCGGWGGRPRGRAVDGLGTGARPCAAAALAADPPLTYPQEAKQGAAAAFRTGAGDGVLAVIYSLGSRRAS